MKKLFIPLNDRSIIKIEGSDGAEFLQGLVSNDINRNNKGLIYCLMQNPKGRFLYDFFVFFAENSIFLDVLAARSEEIIKKLSFFKLRKDVKISKIDDLSVFFCFDDPKINNINIFDDPRVKNFGKRCYLKESDLDPNLIDKSNLYDINRILHKIPESEKDLFYDKSIAVEFGLDNFNAISFEKGCYVGQELTARTHHLGQVRKKVLLGKTLGFTKPNKGDKVLLEGSEIGIMLSSEVSENETLFLMLIKSVEDDFVLKFKNSLTISGSKIELIK